MSETAIKVHKLGKQYRIGGPKRKYSTLRDSIVDSVQGVGNTLGKLAKGQIRNNDHETFWALRDLSFEVKRGGVVGIIGRNGAGKSTLLKILSRITEPTEGHIDLHGRVGSLLEVGTGFHPELTGRENVYLNGAILGMRKWEIDRNFDAIVDFAEIEKFIDTPVKHYSSGMGLRLGFAVAAYLEPEILVVDEVLAVGDASFQAKCMNKMGDVARRGRTVLLVSHNMAAITRLCQEVVWLQGGTIVDSGPAGQLVDRYLNSATMPGEDSAVLGDPGDGRSIWLTYASILDEANEPIQVVRSGQELRLGFRYQTLEPELTQKAQVCVDFVDCHGTPLFMCNSRQSSAHEVALPGCGSLTCRIPNLPLQAGIYTLNFRCRLVGHEQVMYENIIQLQVAEGDFFGTGKLPQVRGGVFLVSHGWQLEEANSFGNL